MDTRKEKDSIGYIDVPAQAYWAAQTQRSTQNFKIGGQKMPCLLYTSPSPRDRTRSRMPSSA